MPLRPAQASELSTQKRRSVLRRDGGSGKKKEKKKSHSLFGGRGDLNRAASPGITPLSQVILERLLSTMRTIRPVPTASWEATPSARKTLGD